MWNRRNYVGIDKSMVQLKKNPLSTENCGAYLIVFKMLLVGQVT